jgi:hypothetical protein
MGVPASEVTLRSQPGGETTKSIRDMWWHWEKNFIFYILVYYELCKRDIVLKNIVSCILKFLRVTTWRWLKKESRNMQLSSFKYYLDIYFIQQEVVLDCQIIYIYIFLIPVFWTHFSQFLFRHFHDSLPTAMSICCQYGSLLWLSAISWANIPLHAYSHLLDVTSLKLV